jgi:hypothetical protein
VDQDAYPPGPIAFAPPYPEVKTYLLSTPVSYISSIPFDIFNQSPEPDPPGGPFGITGGYLGYVHQPELIEMGMLHELWVLLSYGPNGVLDRDEPPLYYDSTNGTVSDGNIFKAGNRP